MKNPGPRQIAFRHAVVGEVRALMGRRNISGARLATQIGMSRSSLSDRLAARVPFRVDELGVIERVLGVPFGYCIALASEDAA